MMIVIKHTHYTGYDTIEAFNVDSQIPHCTNITLLKSAVTADSLDYRLPTVG